VDGTLAHRLGSAVNAFLFPEFFRLKLATAGMLPVRAYRELYLRARRLPHLDIVEVGAGSGTATIAMALAIRDTRSEARIISVEKCEGGSRLDYGDRAANINLLETNLRQFRVRSHVILHTSPLTLANGQEVVRHIRTGQISAFVHDADGRIDRDFALFWPLLRPGGLIVIDDYENHASFQPTSGRFPDGGTKSLVTFRLLNQMMQWGLIKRTRVIGNTFFGFKPETANFGRFSAKSCFEIVSQVGAERDAYLQARGITVPQSVRGSR
jgi:predicted O-methyltransferase YrrM